MAPTDPSDDDLAAGTLLGGHLRVEGRIGAGVHGVVYRVHDERLDRALAVKVQLERDSSPILERLEAQARAMAKIAHPNVCIVHGVGTHDDRAFVVMELVEDGNARQWLAGAPRDWREIVEVYRQAACGLAASHAAGVVHGDFKPDNLLVGRATGGAWRARVTDFGLAHATMSSQDASRSTGRSSVATAPYAAPELRDGAAPSALSDQYALCAALHEALPAASRSAPPWVLAVVSRGVAVDPQGRWPSVDGLAQRLEAGLVGRSRRRIAAIATLVAIPAIAGGIAIGVLARQSRCADADERIATVWHPARLDALRAAFVEAAPERGEQAWTRAGELGATWVETWIDARNASCRATHSDAAQSEELLERSMSCFERRAAELDATLTLLGEGGVDAVHHAAAALGSLRAPSVCGDERYLSARVEPPADVDTVAAVERVRERLRRLDGLLLLERIGDAVAASTDVEAEAEAIGYQPLLAEALLVRGEIALHDDRAKEAIELLQRAHLEARECGDAAIAADAARLLARLEITHGDRAMARNWIALARIELERGAAEPELGVQLERIEGFLARRESKFDEALVHYRKALELAIALDGEHLLAASVRDDISTTLGSAGRGPEAEAAFAETLAAYDRELGPGSPQTAKTHADHGLTLLGFGRPGDAIAEERLALALSTELYGPASPRLFDPTLYLANALATGGELAEARKHAEHALELAEAAGVSRSTDVALALEILGWVAFVSKDYEATIAYTLRADPLLRVHTGEDGVELAQSLLLSAHASYELGRLAEAREMLSRSMEVWRRGGNELHAQAADAWALLSRTQLALGDDAGAKESAGKVITIAEGGMVAPPIVAAARCCLAAAMIQLGDDRTAARELARIGADELRKANVKSTADDCDRWAAGESPRAR